MATPQTEKVPMWARAVSMLIGAIGLPAFLLLWSWGAFDAFLPGPVTAQLREHDEKHEHVQRMICAGVWRDDPTTQAQCWR